MGVVALWGCLLPAACCLLAACLLLLLLLAGSVGSWLRPVRRLLLQVPACILLLPP
jgi:hypothetical protein